MTEEQTLAEFRKQLTDEGLLKEGDTIGTDDATLLLVLFYFEGKGYITSLEI